VKQQQIDAGEDAEGNELERPAMPGISIRA
jgi:hypothetical protein